MTNTYTPNLGLVIEDAITAVSRANLYKIDSFAGTFAGILSGSDITISATNNINLRPHNDLLVGAPISPVEHMYIYADGITISGTTSINGLIINYTDLNFAGGSLGSIPDADAYIAANAAVAANTSHRGRTDNPHAVTAAQTGAYTAAQTDSLLVLKANKNDFDAHVVDTTTHGTTGAIVGTSDLQVLTHKTIDALNNTITNIGNASIISGAGIDYSKLSLYGSIVNSDISTLAAIDMSKISGLVAALAGKEPTLIKGNLSSSTSGVSITGGTSAVIGGGVTINIATASAATTGLLTNTDWIRFDAAAVTPADLSTSTAGVTIVNGTGAVIGSAGDVTINIATASAAATGLLTSTDWSTFNSKQAALGYTPEDVSNKSSNVSLGTSDTLYPTQGAVKSYVDTGLSGKEPTLAKGDLSETTSAILTITGGTGAVIGSGTTIEVAQAATDSDGYLTSGDWNTFAGKQDALGYTPEDVNNKSTDTALGTDDTLYPSQNAVKTYVDTQVQYVSTGVFDATPPALHDFGDGTIGVPAGCIVLIRSTSDHTGNIIKVTVPPPETPIGPFDSSGKYLAVEYNSGSPRFAMKTYTQINSSDVIPIYKIWWDGQNLHYLDSDSQALGLSNKIANSLVSTMPYSRAGQSGLALSEAATRYIVVGSSYVYAGTVGHMVDSYNSQTDTLVFTYYNGSSWVYDTNYHQYDNTQYNPLTGLASLDSNKYVVIWVYRSIGDIKEAFFILGESQYNNVDAARLAKKRTDIPNVVSQHCMLVGRLIVQNGASSASAIESAFDVAFAASTVTAHNNLSGLQGGTTNEYYHTTQDQNLELAAIAALTGPGFAVKTSTDPAAITWANRTLTGTSNRLSISNGNGVSGNPTFNIDTTQFPSSLAADVGKALVSGGANTASWGIPQSTVDLGHSGFVSWGGSGNYYSLSAGVFSVLRSGVGRLSGSKITWAGGESVSGLAANKTYYIGYTATNTLVAVDALTVYSADPETYYENMHTLFQTTVVLFTVWMDSVTPVICNENHPYEYATDISVHDHFRLGHVFTSSGANLSVLTAATATIQSIGADRLDDHGLDTKVPDQTGAALDVIPVFTNASGRAVRYNRREFAVSGVTVTPTYPATYTNNGSTFTVLHTNIAGGAGTIICWTSAGTALPTASGVLTKTSGTGDATITFSAYASPIGCSSTYINSNVPTPLGTSGSTRYGIWAIYATKSDLQTPSTTNPLPVYIWVPSNAAYSSAANAATSLGTGTAPTMTQFIQSPDLLALEPCLNGFVIMDGSNRSIPAYTGNGFTNGVRTFKNTGASQFNAGATAVASAVNIITDTTNFTASGNVSSILSASDTNAQLALDTLARGKASRYVTALSWGAGPPYTMSIAGSTHLRGTDPIVRVREQVGATTVYNVVTVDVSIDDSNGNIVLTSSEAITGKVVVL